MASACKVMSELQLSSFLNRSRATMIEDCFSVSSSMFGVQQLHAELLSLFCVLNVYVTREPSPTHGGC